AVTFTVALLASQLSCTADAGKAEGAKSEAGRSDGTKVATVGDRTITRAELEEHVRPKLIEIENKRYEALREGLDEMIGEELQKREAKARGISTEELQKQEIADKSPAPTDAEIQKVYDDNKAQLGGQSLDQIRP